MAAGSLSYMIRYEAMARLGNVTGSFLTWGTDYEVALLKNGAELTGAGYARVTVPVSGFWTLDGTFGVSVDLLNDVAVTGFAASGGDWVFDTIVIYNTDGSTINEFYRFPTDGGDVYVIDGNSLVIPIGSLRVADSSLQLTTE